MELNWSLGDRYRKLRFILTLPLPTHQDRRDYLILVLLGLTFLTTSTFVLLSPFPES